MESLNKKTDNTTLTKLSISTLIVGTIGLQFAVALFWLCPKNHPAFSSRNLCPALPADPTFFPFLDYPMYATARYEGVQIDEKFLYGFLESGTKVPITDEELGISRYQFLNKVIPGVKQKNDKSIEYYVGIYENKYQKILVKLRVENHPRVITREGIKLGEKQVIFELDL